ncbi:MAG TPA: c-type cytochrome [Chitinophagaceae bacterium]
MKKTFLVVVAFICFIVLSVSFTKAPQGYKNLKILPQDISKQALDSVMHHYSKSLGVKCSFCHVRNEELKSWDMASDAKPEKQIARKMMLMEKGINEKYFPPEESDKNAQILQAVTCYTCHKGDAMPLALPEIKTDSLSRK